MIESFDIKCIVKLQHVDFMPPPHLICLTHTNRLTSYKHIWSTSGALTETEIEQNQEGEGPREWNPSIQVKVMAIC